MLYGVFRFVFFLILVVLLLILFKKKIFKKKRAKIISLVLAALIGSLSFLCPIENAFINFNTPESAFRYSNFGTINAEVQGEKTTLISFSTNQSTSQLILPKNDKGWKIGVPYLTTQIIYNNLCNLRFVVSILHAPNTNDYYIVITDTKSKEFVEVTDSEHSPYVSYKHIDGTIKYYAYVNNFTKSFQINIDGMDLII